MGKVLFGETSLASAGRKWTAAPSALPWFQHPLIRSVLCTTLDMNFGELRYGGVRRIPLPRSWVNKGKRKGRSSEEPRPSVSSASRLEARGYQVGTPRLIPDRSVLHRAGDG